MKNVLVNGGSRGIGREIVRLFSEKGYNVMFTYKKSHVEASALQSETGAVAYCADSAVESDILSAVDFFEKTYGNVEILINNAAVSSFSLITDVELKEWKDMFSVNVDAAFLYSKRVLPAMIRASWGRIINIASMWGIVGSSCEVAYSSTKAALIGMTKALAKELGPSGITVNAVAPGFIDTEMNSCVSQEARAELIEQTPLMRIGTPREVAEAVYFLSSDASSFITGDVINVSGGYII